MFNNPTTDYWIIYVKFTTVVLVVMFRYLGHFKHLSLLCLLTQFLLILSNR